MTNKELEGLDSIQSEIYECVKKQIREEEKYTTLDTDQCKWWVNTLFNMAKEKACNSHNFDDGEEIQAAQDKIIKSLEQQPSEDCVSRAELKKWLDMNFSFGGALRKLEMFDRIDKELPSVTPTRKVGKWIRVGSGSLIDDFRCDCCNKQPSLKSVGYTWGWDFTSYCPNCGARMSEVSE